MDKTQWLQTRMALILMLVAMAAFGLRYVNESQRPVQSDSAWGVSITVDFQTTEEKTRVAVQPPYETQQIRVISRSIEHPGLRLRKPQDKLRTLSRRDELSSAAAGQYGFTRSFNLIYSKTNSFTPRAPVKINSHEREFFLQDDFAVDFSNTILDELAERIGLSDTLLANVPKKITEFLFNQVSQSPESDLTLDQAFSLGKWNEQIKAQTLVLLCRRLNLPARVVAGLKLTDDPASDVRYWAEIYLEDQWQVFAPEQGLVKALPEKFLAFDKSGLGIVSGEGLQGLDVSYTVESLPQSLLRPADDNKGLSDLLYLDRLPPQVREQLALLLLLPFGVLLTAIFRQMIGISSYGVFTPTMLALAITYTSIETTAVILGVAILAVWLARPAFTHVKDRTPRLAITFTLVAVSTAFGVSMLDYFIVSEDTHLILLPIVILTSLMDSFFKVLSEKGTQVAMYRLAWTIAIVAFLLPLLALEWVGYFLLSYPELHFITLGLILFVAEYKGKKLIALPVFNFIREPTAANKLN